jgi:hypothetical protein
MARFPNSPVIELLHLNALGAAISLRKKVIFDAEVAQLRKSTRPTTRVQAFGRDGVAKAENPN